MKKTGDSRYIYKNKVCFQHDMGCEDFKDLTKKKNNPASDRILRDKALILLKIQNMMDIKEVLFLWFTVFLITRLLVVVLNKMKN